jgi:hypothetical protein
MITIGQIDAVLTASASGSLQLHDLVNALASSPVVDPTGFTPVADAAGSNYLTTLQEIEAALAGAARYISDKGDTVGLTNDPVFNQRIGRHVSAS